MVVSIVALTAVLSSPPQPWTAACTVVAIVGFVASFGIGMGPVPWLLPAELFPMDKCAMGAALSAASNWLANFVAGQTFLVQANALGGMCFLPYAAILVLFVHFVQRRVPETRGKTLEQIISSL